MLFIFKDKGDYYYIFSVKEDFMDWAEQRLYENPYFLERDQREWSMIHWLHFGRFKDISKFTCEDILTWLQELRAYTIVYDPKIRNIFLTIRGRRSENFLCQKSDFISMSEKI